MLVGRFVNLTEDAGRTVLLEWTKVAFNVVGATTDCDVVLGASVAVIEALGFVVDFFVGIRTFVVCFEVEVD